MSQERWMISKFLEKNHATHIDLLQLAGYTVK